MMLSDIARGSVYCYCQYGVDVIARLYSCRTMEGTIPYYTALSMRHPVFQSQSIYYHYFSQLSIPTYLSRYYLPLPNTQFPPKIGKGSSRQNWKLPANSTPYDDGRTDISSTPPPPQNLRRYLHPPSILYLFLSMYSLR